MKHVNEEIWDIMCKELRATDLHTERLVEIQKPSKK